MSWLASVSWNYDPASEILGHFPLTCTNTQTYPPPLHAESFTLFQRHKYTHKHTTTGITCIDMSECPDKHTNLSPLPCRVTHLISNTQIHKYKYKQKQKYRYNTYINMSECSELHKHTNLSHLPCCSVNHSTLSSQIHKYKYQQKHDYRWTCINCECFDLHKHANLSFSFQQRWILYSRCNNNITYVLTITQIQIQKHEWML